MAASFIGMALPCMLSLQFIRNATVAGDRVAAMTAEGIAHALSGVRRAVLDADAVVRLSGLGAGPDQRRRPDCPPLDRHHLDRQQPRASSWAALACKYVYYSILSLYAVWGLFVLWRLPALDIAKIGAVLGNVALGFSALHALYANRALLPKALAAAPGAANRASLCCGIFFIGISLVVMADVLRTIAF